MTRMLIPTIATTDGQSAKALAITKKACTAVRDLMRELDLPASAFESVMTMYSNQECLIANEDENARLKARADKIRAITRATRMVARNPQGAVDLPRPRYVPPPPPPLLGVDGLDHGFVHDIDEEGVQRLFDMNDDELEVEYRRVLAEKK